MRTGQPVSQCGALGVITAPAGLDQVCQVCQLVNCPPHSPLVIVQINYGPLRSVTMSE